MNKNNKLGWVADDGNGVGGYSVIISFPVDSVLVDDVDDWS